jgi:hypothetical protein
LCFGFVNLALPLAFYIIEDRAVFADELGNLLALEIKLVVLLLKFDIGSGKLVTEHIKVVLDRLA